MSRYPDTVYTATALIWLAIVVAGLLVVINLLNCSGAPTEPDPYTPRIDQERVIVEADRDTVVLVIEGDLSYWIARLTLLVRVAVEVADGTVTGTVHQEAQISAIGRALLLETLDCSFEGACEFCIRKPTGAPLLCTEFGR
jgi:hypothetical protein